MGPRSDGEPLVSFIVLSYNYEGYIGTTIRSILEQTFQRFEVVVVDDASKDRSCEVVRSFGDPRIRLHVNDRNMGGAWTYNRAVTLARGEYLVNLDADDWIDRRKTALQLEAFERDPSLDILGTHVAFVDAGGKPHPRAPELEAFTNRDHDFNLVDTWIVKNGLCRSSTMLRRSVHERIGLDDPSMARAPDYELWTRALRNGCRFGLLRETLTSLRMHSRGVTFADPRGTFREICWLLLKNVVPLIEERAVYPSLPAVVDWITAHEQFAYLRPIERYRLLGMVLTSPAIEGFTEFERLLTSDEGDAKLESAGRRCFAICSTSPARLYAAKLERDVGLVADARDWWQREAEQWQRRSVEGRLNRALRGVKRRIERIVPVDRVKALVRTR